ncbi:toll/interleukin-1 receptor domain-containing protein [Xanthomonas arboricola]|uniref:toll/interleukin-1 receptor domain-containing protein n=1 Tax=Xanthomonas arboricola TaxID=56448 RepID=UPI003EBF69FF
MKIFISHQRADSTCAVRISKRLSEVHGISSYLDVIDPSTPKSAEELAEHVQRELGKCSQLLTVVSAATQSSWWVPWEIGIATEKNFPLSTYSEGQTPLPEYLKKWPYLRSESDIDKYAEASKYADTNLLNKRSYLAEGAARTSATQLFYTKIRASLRQ